MKKVYEPCFETAWKPVAKLSKSEFDSYKATSFPSSSQYVVEMKFGVWIAVITSGENCLISRKLSSMAESLRWIDTNKDWWES